MCIIMLLLPCIETRQVELTVSKMYAYCDIYFLVSKQRIQYRRGYTEAIL
jgi:hypothetical protein